MKKLITLTTFSVLLIVACTAKKKASASASTESTDAQLTAAKTKFPDVTMEILKKGNTIFHGACTNCHGAKDKDIAKHSEQELSGVLDKMAPKAELSAEQKDQVWKYIMSVKLASK